MHSSRLLDWLKDQRNAASLPIAAEDSEGEVLEVMPSSPAKTQEDGTPEPQPNRRRLPARAAKSRATEEDEIDAAARSMRSDRVPRSQSTPVLTTSTSVAGSSHPRIDISTNPSLVLAPPRQGEILTPPESRSSLVKPTVSEVSSKRSSASPSKGSSSGKRSTSPSKKTNTLRSLGKPVRYELKISALPDDVMQLYRDLFTISSGYATLPTELVDEIATLSTYGEPMLPHTLGRPFPFAKFAGGYNHEEKSKVLHAELDRVQEIVEESIVAAKLQFDEHAWNCHVHFQALKLALKYDNLVVPQAISTARIAAPFRPTRKEALYGIEEEVAQSAVSDTSDRTSGVEIVDSMSRGSHAGTLTSIGLDAPSRQLGKEQVTRLHRLVDFALLLDCDRRRGPPSALSKAIEALLVHIEVVENGPVSINQSSFGPLRSSPIAVTIETKSNGGNAEEARLQLAVWVAAWHERMRLLLGRPPSGSRIVTLPLLLVYEDSWELYFAIDRGSEIEIQGALHMGSTRNVKETYKLLAGIRRLAAWAREEFYTWMMETVAQASILRRVQ